MEFSKRSKWLIVGLVAYLLFLLANIPASTLAKQLATRGVQTSGSSGSIWHGQFTGLRAGVLNLGDIEWRWRFLPLLTGKLAADFDMKQSNGYAQGRAAMALSGKLQFTNLSASLPLQSLLGNGGLPGGWVGTAQIRFDELSLDNNWPVSAQGTLDVVDLTGPVSAPNNIGAYRLSFPAAGGAANTAANTLTGDLKDLDGAALSVVGQLTLNNDRNYLLETQVAARANAPAGLAQNMQILGTPDAQGRRPFSLSGSF